MRKTIAVLGACALAASVLTATNAAAADPQATVYQAKTKSSMSLSTSAASFVQGKDPVKVVATVKSGGKKAKGKVTFYDGKKKLKTLTLKKGKATYKLPTNLKVGTHKIKAKFQPKSKKVKAVSKTKSVQVFSLSLQLDNTAYTVYQDNYVPIGYTARFSGEVTGTWLDFFVGGYRPNELTGDKMKEIADQAPGKDFLSSGVYWWTSRATDSKASTPGTYPVQASFTPLISAAVAVALADFTLTVQSNTLAVGAAIQPGNYRIAEGPDPGSCYWRITNSGGDHPISGGAADVITVAQSDQSLTFNGCGSGPAPA